MNIFTSLRTILTHPQNRNKPLFAVAKVLAWKVNQLTLRVPIIAAISKKTRMICYPDSSYGSFVFYTQKPEKLELDFWENYIQPRDIVFDIGAHVGHYALIAAEKATEGQVYAFEPTPRNFERTQENVRLNNYQDRVIVSQLAIAEKTGTADFVLAGESEVNHLSESANSAEITFPVSVTTLTSICDQQNIDTVAAVKIDTEGAEAAVLVGAAALITSHRLETILLELNPKVKSYHKKTVVLFSLLDAAGYEYFLAEERSWKKVKSRELHPTNTVNVLAVAPTASVQSRIRTVLGL